MTPSSTRPPALRMMFASPGSRPNTTGGSMRESMQVTIATPVPGGAGTRAPPKRAA